MSAKVAVMLDAAYVLKRLYVLLGRQHAASSDVLAFAHACVKQDEELFRIYVYDCPPSKMKVTNPISKKKIDLAASPVAQRLTGLQDNLAIADHVAFRKGELAFSGWKLKAGVTSKLATQSCAASDLVVDLKQKGVDMKIGLDIAWLSSKRIVDAIILATGDTDFVPAMKFARREGVRVIVVSMGQANPTVSMRTHADEVRSVSYPPSPAGATA